MMRRTWPASAAATTAAGSTATPSAVSQRRTSTVDGSAAGTASPAQAQLPPEALGVDHQVHERLTLTRRTLSGSGRGEDGLQTRRNGAGPGFARAAPDTLNRRDAHAADPFRTELGLLEPFQDLAHDGAGQVVAGHFEVEPATHEAGGHPALVVGTCVIAMGAILVSQGLPATTNHSEVLEAEDGRLFEEQPDRVGEVVPGPWVGPQSTELPSLRRSELSMLEGVENFRRASAEASKTSPCADLARRPIALRGQPGRHRAMPIGPEGLQSLDLDRQPGQTRLHPPPLALQP